MASGVSGVSMAGTQSKPSAAAYHSPSSPVLSASAPTTNLGSSPNGSSLARRIKSALGSLTKQQTGTVKPSQQPPPTVSILTMSSAPPASVIVTPPTLDRRQAAKMRANQADSFSKDIYAVGMDSVVVPTNPAGHSSQQQHHQALIQQPLVAASASPTAAPALVSQDSNSTWAFQLGLEDAYDWSQSFDDEPDQIVAPLPTTSDPGNPGDLPPVAAPAPVHQESSSASLGIPVPKAQTPTGDSSDTNWTLVHDAQAQRGSADFMFSPHPATAPGQGSGDFILTRSASGNFAPRVDSEMEVKVTAVPVSAVGSAHVSSSSLADENAWLRCRLQESEKQLEMERERRLMYDAIWTNPYQNDAVGLVEVEFARPFDHPLGLASPASPTAQTNHPTFSHEPEPIDLVVFEMNAKAASRFRRTPENVRGTRMSELLDHASLVQFLEPYKLCLATGEPQHFEHHAPSFPTALEERSAYTLALLGRDSYFKTTVVHIGTNRITGNPICCFFESNVTRYKKQERELVRKNAELAEALGKAEVASKAKDDFLGMISHEIRTPLNGIIGHLALLKETSLEETQLEFVETVRDCSEGLLSLVNDILDLSRAAANKVELDPKPFDLHQTLKTSFSVYKTAEARLKMILDIDPSVPVWTIGDAKRLRQVVINLLSNAVKFTEHGSVECRVRAEPCPAPPKRERDSDSRPGSSASSSDAKGTEEDDDVYAEWVRVNVAVKDSGIGIPAESIAKLFQPFQQIDSSMSRKYQGTGLGLAICKKIIGLMHGDIWVTSEGGNGSTFSFFALLKRCPEDLEGGIKSLERKKQAILSNRVRREREIMAIEGAPPDEVSALGRGLSGSLSMRPSAIADELAHQQQHSSTSTLGRGSGYLAAPPRTGATSSINTLPRGNSGPLPITRSQSPPLEPKVVSLDRSLDRIKGHHKTSDEEPEELTAEQVAAVEQATALVSPTSPTEGLTSPAHSASDGGEVQSIFALSPDVAHGALQPHHHSSSASLVHRALSGFSNDGSEGSRRFGSGGLVPDKDSNPSLTSLNEGAKENYRNLQILIAEDNKINRNLLLKVLGKLGVPADNVTMAVDGEQACEIVFARPTPFDIVYMDLSMPIKSGIEATRHIRSTLPVQRQPKTIVALTANAFEATRVECLSAGMDSFLTKPFRIHEIQAVLDTIALQLPRGNSVNALNGHSHQA